MKTKRIPNRKLEASRKQTEKLLEKVGFKKPRKLGCESYWKDSWLSMKSGGPLVISNSIPGNCYKKELDDFKWKKDREESTETITEIQKKRNRVAPIYSKGALQYITDKTDIHTLGRKI